MSDAVILRFTKVHHSRPDHKLMIEAVCSSPMFAGERSSMLPRIRELPGVADVHFDGELLEIRVTQSAQQQGRRVGRRVARALSVEGGPEYHADVDALPKPYPQRAPSHRHSGSRMTSATSNC